MLDFGATGTSSNFGDSFGGLTAGTDITFSLYVKGSGTIRIYSDGNGTAGYYFESTDITLTNDWKREVLSYTIPAGVSASNFVIQRQVSDTAIECEVYGFQVEAGSYPTSYIPTYGTAASRAGDDNCSVTSASAIVGNNSVLQAFVEFNANNITSQTNDPVLCQWINALLLLRV